MAGENNADAQQSIDRKMSQTLSIKSAEDNKEQITVSKTGIEDSHQLD